MFFFLFILLKHVFETKNIKQTRLAFLVKEEEKISKEEERRGGVVRMTIMALKSGLWIFAKS